LGFLFAAIPRRNMPLRAINKSLCENISCIKDNIQNFESTLRVKIKNQIKHLIKNRYFTMTNSTITLKAKVQSEVISEVVS
jgi:hypothetical protein